jgi:hypothetical protein
LRRDFDVKEYCQERYKQNSKQIFRDFSAIHKDSPGVKNGLLHAKDKSTSPESQNIFRGTKFNSGALPDYKKDLEITRPYGILVHEQTYSILRIEAVGITLVAPKFMADV